MNVLNKIKDFRPAFEWLNIAIPVILGLSYLAVLYRELNATYKRRWDAMWGGIHTPEYKAMMTEMNLPITHYSGERPGFWYFDYSIEDDLLLTCQLLLVAGAVLYGISRFRNGRETRKV